LHELQRQHQQVRSAVAHGVLSFSNACPAALHCTRSTDSAGRVMLRHSCSSRLRSCGSQRTAALQAQAIETFTALLLMTVARAMLTVPVPTPMPATMKAVLARSS
jgi:hypothetical protein